MTKVRSARGQIVDFDLLKIKQEIEGNAIPPVAVKARQDFIDNRIKRRIKAAKAELDTKQINVEKQDKQVEDEKTVDQQQENNDNNNDQKDSTESTTDSTATESTVIKQKTKSRTSKK